MSTFVKQEINKRNRWVYFTKRRWIAHVVYWVWVLLIGTVFRISEPITVSVIYNQFLLANLFIAAFFYIYCLFLIPYFFKRNKNVQFWLWLTFLLLTMPIPSYLFNHHFVEWTGEHTPDRGPLSNYLDQVYSYLANFMIFSIMLFFMEKNEENDLLMEVEQEKKEIEQVKLDLLKTNISPDFMMRSLKQLKRAAIVPETCTPDAIITFSELLRYRLYRGKQLQTPLSEEIGALKTFVSFVGYDNAHNNLLISLQIDGDLEGKNIAALALINIMEPFCKVIPESLTALQLDIRILQTKLEVQILYNKKATPMLMADLNQYGVDYINLYGDAVLFNFENCADDTCKIDVTLPLLAHH